MSIKVQITYEKTTPESVENGETSDNGFCLGGGWFFSIADDDFRARCERDGREKALDDMTPDPEEFESLDDAVEFLRSYGPFEASCHPVRPGDHCWLTQSDTDVNYSTGEETRLSFHVEADAETHYAVIKACLD